MMNQPPANMLLRPRRPRLKEGDYFSIALGDNLYAYGRVLGSPALAFYDGIGPPISDVNELKGRQVLFKIWVMKDAFRRLNWQIIRNEPLEEGLRRRLVFFKKDKISGELSLYYSWPGRTEEVPATLKQCERLECAAVWSACHVEERLLDHVRGAPNKHVRLF